MAGLMMKIYFTKKNGFPESYMSHDNQHALCCWLEENVSPINHYRKYLSGFKRVYKGKDESKHVMLNGFNITVNKSISVIRTNYYDEFIEEGCNEGFPMETIMETKELLRIFELWLEFVGSQNKNDFETNVDIKQ